MPEVSAHTLGAFCWMELGTTDPEAAKTFYSAVFGWEYNDTEMPGDMGTYTMIRKDGKDVAGMYTLPPMLLEAGVPPHWLSYINVDNVDETTNLAESLGAEVKQAPMDVMDIGRMSVIQDPTGAAIAMWQAKNYTGSTIRDEPDTACWFELVTPNREVAQDFYRKTFGYEIHEQDMGGMIYTMLGTSDGARHGGIMQITPEMGEVPPHWMIYVAVADVEATRQKAEGAGANIIVPGMDVPGVGRFCMFMDPQGAAITAIQLAG